MRNVDRANGKWCPQARPPWPPCRDWLILRGEQWENMPLDRAVGGELRGLMNQYMCNLLGTETTPARISGNESIIVANTEVGMRGVAGKWLICWLALSLCAGGCMSRHISSVEGPLTPYSANPNAAPGTATTIDPTATADKEPYRYDPASVDPCCWTKRKSPRSSSG